MLYIIQGFKIYNQQLLNKKNKFFLFVKYSIFNVIVEVHKYTNTEYTYKYLYMYMYVHANVCYNIIIHDNT